MSMTKRYLESLPAEVQDDILGLPPADDEWPEEKGDEECLSIFEQVEQAPLCKPRGKCVLEKAADGVWWKL